MQRKYIVCKDSKNEGTCSLVISGNEDEVLDLAVIHGIITHGHNDPHALRKQLQPLLRDAPESRSASA